MLGAKAALNMLEQERMTPDIDTQTRRHTQTETETETERHRETQAQTLTQTQTQRDTDTHRHTGGQVVSGINHELAELAGVEWIRRKQCSGQNHTLIQVTSDLGWHKGTVYECMFVPSLRLAAHAETTTENLMCNWRPYLMSSRACAIQMAERACPLSHGYDPSGR